MDHLPSIKDSAFAVDEVFYIEGPNGGYDGSGISEFPLKKGYAFGKGPGVYSHENYILHVNEKHDGSLSEVDRQMFLIEWLFFGPLADIYVVLGLQFQAVDFVDQSDKNNVLHFKNLEAYTLRWKAQESTADSTHREHRSVSIYNILESTDLFYDCNIINRQRRTTIFSVSPECSLLIRILHEALRNAWGAIHGSEGNALLSGSGIASDLPDQRMRAANWCPSEIDMLKQRFTVTGRDFASRLKRRRTIMNHGQCSETKCYTSQIDNDTYATKHTKAGCHCNHIKIESDAVEKTLQAGKIPRFLVMTCADTPADLEIKTVDSGPYIAISHVWAHGLGNSQNNSLPLCQIRRLHNYVLSLKPQLKGDCAHESIGLWIDTLGVPLERDSRKLALGALQRTYADSTGCLVLDEELYQASRDCSPEEILFRLALSTWSRRLWTFQEGFVTGEKLFLQFFDGPRAFQDLRMLERPSLCSSLFRECTEDSNRNLPRERDFANSKQGQIAAITEACRYRTTSRLSDEAFCLASIAGHDVQNIIQASTHEDKMRLFLLQLYAIPKNIIFHRGPRLIVENFHWAPHSFLYPEPSSNIFGAEDDDNDPKALCLPCGLQAQWPGFLLDFSQCVKFFDIYWFKFRDFWILVHPISSVKQKFWAATAAQWQQAQWQQVHKLKQPALLVKSLDSLQNVGLIVAVESFSAQAMIASCILRVNAFILPISEPEIVNPRRLALSRGFQISGSLVDETAIWTLR